MPAHLVMRDGALWNGSTLVPTPEEEDVYRALGLAWLAPELRCPPTRMPAHS